MDFETQCQDLLLNHQFSCLEMDWDVFKDFSASVQDAAHDANYSAVETRCLVNTLFEFYHVATYRRTPPWKGSAYVRLGRPDSCLFVYEIENESVEATKHALERDNVKLDQQGAVKKYRSLGWGSRLGEPEFEVLEFFTLRRKLSQDYEFLFLPYNEQFSWLQLMVVLNAPTHD